ncbi:hypothetical protein ACS0TY_033537 [Phlomoides rotata]
MGKIIVSNSVILILCSMIEHLPGQAVNMSRLICGNTMDYYDNLRMDRNAFGRLCIILKNLGGLIDGKHMSVEEQVTIFLSILVHDKKNRVVKFYHQRSGQTVSHYVNAVLLVVLRLHTGCLGAIDDTYVNVHVPEADKGRYRIRKGTISTNVIAACDRNCLFTDILPGWEGLTSNARGLRDSISRVHVGSSRKTTGNTRRVCTTREEKVLLAALKDLVAKGQKTDNAFHTGYLNKLEDALRKAFPGCDLQATPHIMSKITTWRKHYSAIVTTKLGAT